MKYTFYILFFILFIFNSSYSQTKEILLSGKIRNTNNDVSNILIINKTSKKSTITDSLGLFSIAVKQADILQISAVQYHTKEVIITKKIFHQKQLRIQLQENIIELKEAIVRPYNLTGDLDLDVDRIQLKPQVSATSIGLPNADVMPMTINERKLLEADRGKFVQLTTIDEYGKIIGYLTPSIVINTHKIMNSASGRTKMLKERVSRDEKILIENKIISVFSKSTIAEGFSIPKNEIDAFLSYCLVQPDFKDLQEAKNNMQIWAYLKKQSIAYKTVNNLEFK